MADADPVPRQQLVPDEDNRALEDTTYCTRSEEGFRKTAPKFFGDGSTTWSQFLSLFDEFAAHFSPSPVAYKSTLYTSLNGQALSLAAPNYAPRVPKYAAMTVMEYREALRNLFEPESEQGLRMSTYLSRTQLPNEHATRYFQAKLTAFQRAFPHNQPWEQFYEQFARGLINDTIRAFIRRYTPNPIEDYEAYRDQLMKEIAIVQARYLAGELNDADIIGSEVQAALSTNPVYNMPTQDIYVKQERVMAIRPKMGDKTCFHCNEKGHFVAQCPRKLAALPKVATVEGENRGHEAEINAFQPRRKRFPVRFRNYGNQRTEQEMRPKPRFQPNRARISMVQDEQGEWFCEVEEGSNGTSNQVEDEIAAVTEGIDAAQLEEYYENEAEQHMHPFLG